MRPHHKMLLGMALVFTFVLIFPTTFAFSESHTMGSTEFFYERTIFPEVHRGRIQFTFTANDTLTVSITNSNGVQILWTTYGTNGSCDLDVNKTALYRATFSKGAGSAVYIQYTVTEQSIPGFLLLLTIFLLLATLGLIYLKRQWRSIPH
jgi:hypothetical protein